MKIIFLFFLTSIQAQILTDAYFFHKTIIIPKDDKRHRGGDDDALATDKMLVVADGVGGWIKFGIDPGLFTRHLVTGLHQ